MHSNQTPFDYQTAFTRNLGWVTELEQALLRSKRIAIAGMGGVGGSHLLTLTRAGVGAFTIADFDTFEQANFNRQAGASGNHLGQLKVDVMTDLARDINPELDIRKFPEGITDQNIAAFLDDVDLFIDGLDFFALDARRQAFALCAQKKIPAITAAPLGMGSALINFLPGRMSFEEYFRLEGQDEMEQMFRFVIGLSPALLQMPYLVDNSRVDFKQRKVPSTVMSCELCAGMAATETIKILLERGPVSCAPHGIHFDAYRNEFVRTWRPLGNNNPLQQIGLFMLRRHFKRQLKVAPEIPSTEPPEGTSLGRILNLARWAPSGDNLQPWRFTVENKQQVLIHSPQNGQLNVYDLKGWANQLSLGALIENMAIAASAEGQAASFKSQQDSVTGDININATFSPDETPKISPLLPFIRARSTQRRSMKTIKLNTAQRGALEESAAPFFKVRWFESTTAKWQLARLIFKNAQIRLSIPEAYLVHKEIIEWNARFSQDRIPDQSLGLDSITLRLMRSVMKTWPRVQFMNRFMGGTLLSRIQLDLLPAMNCGAQFILMATSKAESVDDYIRAGRAIQRFWLTATKLGLQLQPQLTPIMFSHYARENIAFTADKGALAKAKRLSQQLSKILGAKDMQHALFMGRIGVGKEPQSRSLRKPLSQLYNTPR